MLHKILQDKVHLVNGSTIVHCSRYTHVRETDTMKMMAVVVVVIHCRSD
jgi:hypothetical protein